MFGPPKRGSSTTSRLRAGKMYAVVGGEKSNKHKPHTPRTCSRASRACHPLSQIRGGNVSSLLSFLSCNAASRLSVALFWITAQPPEPAQRPVRLAHPGKDPAAHAPQAVGSRSTHAPRATKGDQGRRSGSNGCLCHRRHRSAPHRDHINSCVLVFVERIDLGRRRLVYLRRAEDWRKRRHGHVYSGAALLHALKTLLKGRDSHTHTTPVSDKYRHPVPVTVLPFTKRLDGVCAGPSTLRT